MKTKIAKILCMTMAVVTLAGSVPQGTVLAAGNQQTTAIITTEETGKATATVWAATKSYVKGDIVSYKGTYYQCLQPHTSLEGWEPTNVPALWVEYSGEIETDTVEVTAITLEKTEVAMKKGESVVLKATVAPENATDKTVTWTSSNTSVVKVENGVITAIAAGQASITATAGVKSVVCNVTVTEEGGSEIVTPPVTKADLPDRVLTGYWQNFDNGATCLKLADVPKEYNIICISFADATQTPGEITFQLDKTLSEKLGGYTIEQFKADVATAHSKGQKVVLAIGGEVGNVIINSPEAAQKFADSAYALMQEYGFDGVDVDLEHGIDVTNLANALHLLADKAGKGFILTMAPQTLDVYTYDATYLKLAREVKDILTIMNTQYYNSGGMPGYDGKVYSQGTVGFLNALAVTQLESGLRPDQIGIGVPAVPKAAGGGYQDAANVAAAVESLVYGTEAGGFTPPKAYADFRGAMTWSINWDASNNYKFANTMTECFAKLPAVSNGQTSVTENVNTDSTKPDTETNTNTETTEPGTETIVEPGAETTKPDTETTVESGTETTTEKTEPPYPFWKDYKNYPEKNTMVYYKGKIYQNKWYANSGVKPDAGDPWVLVGDAEWTVTEDEKNYQKNENAEAESLNKVLTDAEIDTLYGGINKEYSPEAAVGRLTELISKEDYEALFPYRFGSEGWKNCSGTAQYYPDTTGIKDYYSYENLQTAVQTMSDTIIKVQWYEGAEWCYRIIRLNKSTKEQKLVYSDPSFDAEWLVNSKELKTSVCDYGSFLAVGDLNTRKRELSGFLANISHETGGGTIQGEVDEELTGLYFNEEVGFIGSSAIGYVQSTGTNYLPVEGKSYHGRGPIQLSYNYNYGLCSDVLFGDSSILLKNPEKVTEDGVTGIMTGIWFWMTPQPPKPSCHQVITGIWEPKAGAPNEKYNGNFGLTIVIINNESGQSENGTGAVARRARYYRIFANKMGADISKEQCDTVGMTTFVQQPTT